MGSRSIKNRPSAKKKHPVIGLLAVVTVLTVAIGAGAAGIWAMGTSWIGDLESYDITQAAEFNTEEPSSIVASDGTTELARLQLENRDPVELDQISPYVLKGTVATEDERYYEHGGFDLWGIARAAVVTLTGSGREGASTITQQFVRNTILADEMDDISIKRKVREMYLSVKLEEAYTKDEILRMYLNTINYGNGAYGIQAASQRYFSKNAADLTIAEAATLIGIPQSPTYNEPINHGDNSLARRNLVLDRMLTNNVITQEEHDAAQAEPIVLNPTEPSIDGIEKYPYFTSYVIQALQDVNGKYKYSDSEVRSGGLTIVTTLDVATQEAAEAAIREKEEGLDPAISGSLVAIDPDTGHVKALVGGKDWATQKTNLATGSGTDGGRPCGSAFKTFTLVTALEAGIDPQTMVDCTSPSSIPNTGWESTDPEKQLHNYDNYNYGTRSIERAFAVSSNTGFVRLEMALGANKVLQTAQRMGITSKLEAVPSLTLGQYNVTMLDMAKAYATIANGGTGRDAEPILQIVDSSGNILFDNSAPAGSQIISPEVAHAATEVMKSVVDTSEGTGTAAALYNGQEVAAKTGTSTEYNDITFCGITPQLSVAIWFGDPENMVQLPTSTNAADVFRNFMNQVLEGQPTEKFPQANDPTYSKNYSDKTYHIGNYAYSSNTYSNTNSNDSNSSDETKKEEKKESSSSSSSSSSGSSSNTNNGGSSSGGGSGETGGGSSGGGESGGGSSSESGGGTSGGESGGGTSGGGASGGGTSGGTTS